MNQIVAAYPDRELHVVLDNLNTHKPKHDRWLKRHPNVHLHFTPTYSSWFESGGMLVQHPGPTGPSRE
jgi:transposase